jgi:hypothetical protein
MPYGNHRNDKKYGINFPHITVADKNNWRPTNIRSVKMLPNNR